MAIRLPVRRGRPTSRWRRRRRVRIAAGAALIAVGIVAGLLELRPGTSGAGTPVVYAAHPIAGGATIGESDIATAVLPAGSPLLAAALPAEQVLGRTALGHISAGELLTASRLAPSGPRAGYVTMPVVFERSELTDFLHSGDVVDIMWIPDQIDDRAAEVVVRGATVVRAPQEAALGAGSAVLLEVREEDAARLAAAAAAGSLSVVQR